ERLTQFPRPRVLPNDGAVQRPARRPVPHHRRLALVGDAYRGDLLAARARAPQRPAHHILRPLPDLLRVVLDPAGLGPVLCVFLLRHAGDGSFVVEQDAAGAGGSLIDRRDKSLHPRIERATPTPLNSRPITAGSQSANTARAVRS